MKLLRRLFGKKAETGVEVLETEVLSTLTPTTRLLPDKFVCIKGITTDGGFLGQYQFQKSEILERLEGESNYSSGLVVLSYETLIRMSEYFQPL